MYKCTDLKRLLAPKIRKREESIDEFFTNLDQGDNLDESGDSLALNPVVQAKIAIDLHNNVITQPKKRGAFAYGALKKLKLDLGDGRTSKANWNAHAFKMVDRSLQQEAHAEAQEFAKSFRQGGKSLRPGAAVAAPAKSFKPAGKKAPGVSTTLRKKNIAAVQAAARIQDPEAPASFAGMQRPSFSCRNSHADL